MSIKFQALFDTLDNLKITATPPKDLPNSLIKDFTYSISFLASYTGSLGTFNSYRREIERLLQWCWHIQHKSIVDLKRQDIEDFLHFCQNPPQDWISTQKTPRFIEKSGMREANPLWRPFVVTTSKFARQQGQIKTKAQFELSQGAMQEIFAILSTFFNFLVAEEYCITNPISLIRQKSQFIRKHQHNAPIRRLSLLQWKAVLNAAQELATKNPQKYERTLFMLHMLYGLYLRISELAASKRWIPMMNDFFKDSNNCWWFKTVGKGNKERQIAVSDELLNSLIRWRKFLGLPALPHPSDNSPLIPKIRGKGAMSDTAPLRRLVQECFDKAAFYLNANGYTEDANIVSNATVHWLRHTGISEDVKTRPREHVRDDAGHSSSATTDRYIDIELKARHASAKNKTIKTTID